MEEGYTAKIAWMAGSQTVVSVKEERGKAGQNLPFKIVHRFGC